MIDQSAIFADIVGRRRSVRGFLSRRVDQLLLQGLFRLAQRAPSNCNIQPWKVYVVSGDRLEQLREALCVAMANGETVMDFPFDLNQYHGVYKARQVAAAKALFAAQGIGRDDGEARQASFMRNYQFFNAPHAAFVFLPEQFGIREAVDVGMYAQTLMLAFTANGIACCPQTSLSFQAPLVRQLLGLDESEKLLFGISFGYEDTAVAANRCRTERAVLSESVQFIDFDSA